METRTLVFRTGMAIAAIGVVVILSPGEHEQAPARPADASGMFSFIKPLPEVPVPAAEQPMMHASAHGHAPPQRPARDSVATMTPDVASVEQEVRRLRSEGASDDEVYRLRSQRVSPEAAARLAQMEREESLWQARVEQYLSARARLLSPGVNTPGASPLETVQQLRNAYFSAEEQDRLSAVEPLHTPQLTMN